MDITELLFDQECSPKMFYNFDPVGHEDSPASVPT
jgi:hypothetical protein